MAQAGTAISEVLRPNTLLAQDTDFRSRALDNGVAKELSANAKQRGLRYWMVTCFDLVQFKVPQHDERLSTWCTKWKTVQRPKGTTFKVTSNSTHKPDSCR